MQPWTIAALAAWALAHRDEGGSIRVENPDTEGLGYTWRMGLADYFGVDTPVGFEEHEETGRFITLRTIGRRDDLADLLSDLVTLLHVIDAAAESVLYAMSEMVRNTLEHSRSVGAVVCAQRYPRRGDREEYVSLGIADRGVGVLTSLSRQYVLPTAAEALVKAIEPGVSGAVPGMYGAPDNAGAGLFVTRQLSEATQRYFGIASGDAMFRTSTAKKPHPDTELVLQVAPYSGTVVCVEIGLSESFDYSRILQEAWASLGTQEPAVSVADVSEKVIFA
jgi:hypothetical protein